jgi:hypothetical protein
MTTQDAMSILYPVLTTAVFLNAVLLFMYWLMIRRTRQVLAHVTFFASEFVVLLLLTLPTGTRLRLIWMARRKRFALLE